MRAQLAPEVSQDLQALEQKVKEVLLEILGFLGLWDLLDQKAHLDLLGFLDHQANQVLRVSVANQAHLGLKVTGGLLDFKDLKVNRVTKVSEVCQVILVYQVYKGQLERKEPKDPLVIKDLLGPLDSEALLGLLVIMEFKEHLGFKDHQGYQGIQDSLARKVKQVNQEESSTQLAPLLLVSQDHLGLLVLLAQQDLQDYQVPLALLVCLAKLVLKVTGELRENQEQGERLIV